MEVNLAGGPAAVGITAGTTSARGTAVLPWSMAAGCLLGVALALPEWVPDAWSREDGPVENVGFVCFALSALLALRAAVEVRHHRGALLLAIGLSLISMVAAGEEISWGQRWFDLETPEVLVDGNRQDELNLHNLEQVQSKAVYAQLGVAAVGLVAATTRRWRWLIISSPCFAGYLSYRAARAGAAAADWAPAGRNAEAAEVFLAVGLLLIASRLRRMPRPEYPGS